MESTPESTDPATSGNGQVGNAGSGVDSSVATSLLSVRGISKNFGPVQALQDCDLDVPAGEVTALLGDNGAGKSTFIKCVSGIYAPSAGTMYWRGTEAHVHSPRDAAALGIATVYQDLALCDNLDIVENMYLGREETKFGMLDEITMEVATKQAVAVARAVMRDSQLVIMDEPTAALGVTQTKLVLELIRTLASKGIAVLVISHNLTDVFTVADRIAVMHLGTIVSHGPIANYDTTSAVELITTGESSRVASRMASSL
jgi:D-xylose transport system ATP-binding protein